MRRSSLPYGRAPVNEADARAIGAVPGIVYIDGPCAVGRELADESKAWVAALASIEFKSGHLKREF